MIIKSLDRKLLRDISHMWGQVFAIILILACGVAVFVMAVNMLGVLRKAMNNYYERYRFAHVFVHLKRAPESLADRIREIPGVAQVQHRIVSAAILDMPHVEQPVSARLVSIPDRPIPGLNELFIRSGRYVEAGRSGEVLVNEAFAEANRLTLGDTITAVLNGRNQQLRIVGIALSPEFIYQIGPGQMLPDDRLFGVIWMAQSDLAAVFDMKNAMNDVVMTLTPGASEPEVIRRIDQLTQQAGGLGAYSRDDQTSHEFVSNELKELRGMAVVVPGIFLAVAAFLLNVVMSRTISTQREQIATLKAFGYTQWELVSHYLKFVGVIVFIGSFLGLVVGVWLGRNMTSMYTRFFHFPVFEFTLDPMVVMLAVLIAGGSAVAGTIWAVWMAIQLPPAEAMKPEAPVSYSHSLLVRFVFTKWLPSSIRMIIRQIERKWFKTMLTTFGISLAVAVVILGSFARDAIDHVLVAMFSTAQRQDHSVSFMEPSSSSVLHEVAHLPGVLRVEPLRMVSVRLKSNHLSKRLGLTGVKSDGSLFRIMDIHFTLIPLPADGLVLSRKLAEILNLNIGDMVQIEVLEGARPMREAVVSGLVDDFSGTSAYMEIDAVHKMMREGDVVTGAFMKTDPLRHREFYAAVKKSPHIAGAVYKWSTVENYHRTIGENIMMMRLINVVFAGIIAFGVVYNSARIALAERSRELATLRVLGFTRGEVARILLGELTLLTLVAVPCGMFIGYGLSYFVIHTVYDTELFRLPLIINFSTYGFAASITLGAAMASFLVINRRIANLDMISVLKNVSE